MVEQYKEARRKKNRKNASLSVDEMHHTDPNKDGDLPLPLTKDE